VGAAGKAHYADIALGPCLIDQLAEGTGLKHRFAARNCDSFDRRLGIYPLRERLDWNCVAAIAPPGFRHDAIWTCEGTTLHPYHGSGIGAKNVDGGLFTKYAQNIDGR
jgi:hypothetical protein